MNEIALTPPDISNKTAAWSNFSITNLFKSVFPSVLSLLNHVIFGAVYFLINLIIDLPVSCLITLLSLDSIKIPSLSASLFSRQYPNSSTPLVKELLELCSFKKNSFGSLYGRNLALLAVNLFKDLGNTLSDTISRLFLGFYDIFLDAKIQFKKEDRTAQCKKILSGINTSLSAIQEKRTKLLDSLMKDEKSMLKAQKIRLKSTNSISITSPETANVPYHLSSGEWNDIVNVVFDKIKTSLDEGVTYALAKHPFQTNLMLALQLGAMLSILAPTAIPQVTQMYMQIFSFLQNTLTSICPPPVLNATMQIINNDVVKYIQITQMLENIIGINQPLGIDSEDSTPYKPQSDEYSRSDKTSRQTKKLRPFLQMEVFQLLLTKQDVLRYLSYREKRLLMMTIEELFKDIKNKDDFIKGVSHIVYPPTKKTSLNQTLTIIVDYIPLLTRCFLSPVTFSLRPWYELVNKIINDLTRIMHAMSRLSNALFYMTVRVFIRAPGDILVNEIAARVEGAIHDNKHSISQDSYQLSQYCNQTIECIRQNTSTGIDTMRRMSGSPNQQTVLKSAAAYLHSSGFFSHEKEPNFEQHTEHKFSI